MSFLEGGCLCGAIRFRLTGIPSSSVICHCRSCRKASGAPSVAWLTFPLRNFELLGDEPHEFTSSPGVVRTFCPTCGSPVTYATADSPKTIDVATALLDDEAAFPPDREIWLDHKLSWQPVDASLIQCRESGV